MLSGWIDHDDRKGLDRWLSEQNRYMIMEARKLLETPKENLNLPDRLRRWIVPAPPLAFFYTLLTKGLILDGWAGVPSSAGSGRRKPGLQRADPGSRPF